MESQTVIQENKTLTEEIEPLILEENDDDLLDDLEELEEKLENTEEEQVREDKKIIKAKIPVLIQDKPKKEQTEAQHKRNVKGARAARAKAAERKRLKIIKEYELKKKNSEAMDYTTMMKYSGIVAGMSLIVGAGIYYKSSKKGTIGFTREEENYTLEW